MPIVGAAEKGLYSSLDESFQELLGLGGGVNRAVARPGSKKSSPEREE